MKKFVNYKHEYDAGKVNSENPNVDTYQFHRKAIQYKNEKLRKGIYQPKKQRGVYRRNRIFNAERFTNQVITKIKEGSTILGFKAFIAESTAGEALDTYNKRKLISTFHSKERTEEREANEAIVKHIFRHAVDHLAKHGGKYSHNEHFVVTSKKYDRSAAFHYRPDSHATNDTHSHFIHTTTFPVGEHYANKQSKKIVVENVEIDYICFDVE
jgi:hypothetical protein